MTTTWQLSRVFKTAAIGVTAATLAVVGAEIYIDGFKNALSNDLFMVKPWGVYIPVISPWGQAIIDPLIAAWQTANGHMERAPDLLQHSGKAVTVAGYLTSRKLFRTADAYRAGWNMPVSWRQWRPRR